MLEKAIRVGDRVLVEQAWEDETGNYHDEYAIVKDEQGVDNFVLTFDDPRVDDFLDGFEWSGENLQKIS